MHMKTKHVNITKLTVTTILNCATSVTVQYNLKNKIHEIQTNVDSKAREEIDTW